MNIFVVDKNPVKAAQMLCDKHIVKMPVETAQMLSTVCRLKGFDIGYKSTHTNHPCTVWVRDSKENFNWAIQHGIALCDEYSFRYGKTHASKKVIQDIDSIKKSLTFGWESLTMFAQAVPVEYKNSNDAVAAYRKYYLEEKSDIAHWNKNRKAPEWWTKCVK